MAYTTREQIETVIAPDDLIAALNDDNTPGPKDEMLADIIANASTDIDGALANIYSVPFGDPAPAFVQRCALVFACETIYERRLSPQDKNPMTKQADRLRARLEKISNGEAALDCTVTRAFEPGYAALEPVSIDMTSA